VLPEYSEQWKRDCLRWRGRVLTGKNSHWCYEWDGLPIDETTPEWPCACASRRGYCIADGVLVRTALCVSPST
jgi:hypothetical protein